MELLFLEVEWRFATTTSTTQFVMRGGLTMMLKLSVVPTLATTLHLIVSTQVSIHFFTSYLKKGSSTTRVLNPSIIICFVFAIYHRC